MNAVMAGRVEDVFERAQLGDDIGVDPKLVQEIHLRMNQEDLRRNEQRQREIEDPREVGLHHALPKGGRQVVVFTRMVSLMGRPEEVHL